MKYDCRSCCSIADLFSSRFSSFSLYLLSSHMLDAYGLHCPCRNFASHLRIVITR